MHSSFAGLLPGFLQDRNDILDFLHSTSFTRSLYFSRTLSDLPVLARLDMLVAGNPAARYDIPHTSASLLTLTLSALSLLTLCAAWRTFTP